MNRHSLCRQLNNRILNIFRELLDTGVTYFFLFFPLYLAILIIYIYIYIYPVFIEFPVFDTWKEPDEKVLRCFIVLFSPQILITNGAFVYYNI